MNKEEILSELRQHKGWLQHAETGLKCYPQPKNKEEL